MKRKLLLTSLLCALIGTANAQSVSTATYGNASDSSTRTLAVSLNYPTEPDFVAFALQLDLPEGTTVTGVKAMAPLKNGGTIDLSEKGGTATESTDFKVDYNNVANNKCNIIGYNFGNEPIVGNSGDVLLAVTLNVENESAFEATPIKTSSSFVNSKATESTLTPYTPEKGVERLMGDVNRDKAVTTADVNQANNVYLKKVEGSSLVDFFAGDVDFNEIYTSSDINKINNIYLKK